MEILDCTIRDGGYVNNWDFSVEMVRDLYRRLSKAGISVVELGFRDADPDSVLWRRCPEDVLKTIKTSDHGAKVSVMVDFGKAGAKDFVPADESLVDIVRVAVHRNKVALALDLIRELKDLGYLTSLQTMGYDQYSDEERTALFRLLEKSPVDYVYAADSYGSMFPYQIPGYFKPLKEAGDFKVGFHPHNNLQLAFANTIEAIRCGVDIVDSSLYGMGRGAGNLATETLIAYLDRERPDSEAYNLVQCLLCVDTHIFPLRKKFEWGYQLPYMLSGISGCHPTYSKFLVDARRYTIDNVWRALSLVRPRRPVGFDKDLIEEILSRAEFEPPADLDDNETRPAEAVAPEKQPAYVDRHKNRTFLVLANGPGLRKHKDKIDRFIERHDPIILGANYLADMFRPDYHAFMNKRRFMKYVGSVHEDSRLLINCFFSEDFIRDFTDRPYEEIVFRQGPRELFEIKDGIPSSDCVSVSLMLIAVAVVMGAGEVYIAGLDGFLGGETDGDDRYFYSEADDTDSSEFNKMRHRWNSGMLELLDRHLVETGRSGVNIITPTSYKSWYRSIESLI